MAPLPPRVTFVVGTSLLSASLSLGCTPKKAPEQEDKNKKVQQPAPEHPPDNVNTGPQEEPKPEPEPIHVNEGPQPEPPPEPPPPDVKVNPGPEPIEEKRVNTRPTDL
jgi:hypothetical protein